MLAILVAREAAKAGVPTFTFISAAANFPGIPSRYITSKRFGPTLNNSSLEKQSRRFPKSMTYDLCSFVPV